MRRLTGWLLVGLGAFLLVVALMSRFYLPDRLIKTPIDQYAKTNAIGNGTYFNSDPNVLQEQSADLVARRTVKGDVDSSGKDIAVWDVSLVIETGDGALVRATLDRVATDRRSAEAVNCCGESVDGNPMKHSGVSYKFPFFTEKKDYQFWDVNSQQSYPAKYTSEETIQGLTTYKFIQPIAGHELRTQEGAGPLVGESPSFNPPVWYENVRTVWVEPRTGVIVKGSEQTKTTLRNAQGEDRLVVLEVTFTFDDATQRSQAKLAKDGIKQINAITMWLPLLGLVLGLLALLGGWLLLRGGRQRGTEVYAGYEQPVPPDGTTERPAPLQPFAQPPPQAPAGQPPPQAPAAQPPPHAPPRL
jgi:Porin PorA